MYVIFVEENDLMKKRKLIYVIHSLGVGGTEVALLSAIPKLCENFDFQLIVLKKYDQRLVRNFSKNELRSIIVFSGIFSYIHAFTYLRKQCPQIIISSLWKGALLALAQKKMNKSVQYIHFVHSSKFFHILDRMVSIQALKKADVIFCDSMASKEFVFPYTKGQPMKIISFLRFQNPVVFENKQSISPRGLYVGRIHPCKRLDRLVLFVNQLIVSGIDFYVDLYGRDDGAMLDIVQLIKRNHIQNNIVFKGEVEMSEVKDLFAQYDFYIQTSEAEGMAMSVVEAMQHGLVCILTNVGEIRNYAKPGENAIIIDEPFEEHMSTAVNACQELITKPELYNKIANNAFTSFKSKEIFADSLVNTILNSASI